jgi:hypothetical protein
MPGRAGKDDIKDQKTEERHSRGHTARPYTKRGNRPSIRQQRGRPPYRNGMRGSTVGSASSASASMYAGSPRPTSPPWTKESPKTE